MSIWLLHYSIRASFLLSCIMASNTLIAYPIVSRYGLQQKPSVTLSVGSSMLSLLIALIMLAGLVASFSKHDGVLFWLFFAAKFAAYCGVMIFLIPRLTRWFLRRYSDSVMQFIFVMAMLFMSAALSQMVGIEGVFGAFFAGLICLLTGVQFPMTFTDKGNGHRVTVDADETFDKGVLWQQDAENFVCMEPWNGWANSVNEEGKHEVLDVDEAMTSEWSITIEKV